MVSLTNILEGARMLRQADVTDNQIKILEKMKLTTLDQAQFFDAEQKANPALKSIMSKHENALANNPAYTPVLQAMGGRFVREVGQNPAVAASGKFNTVLDTLGKDIQANPALADRLDKMIAKGDPETMKRLAGSIGTYQSGQLAAVLNTADPASAPAVAAPAAAPAGPAPAAAKPPAAPAAAKPPPVTVAAPSTAAPPAAAPPAAAPPQQAPQQAPQSAGGSSGPAKPVDMKALADMPNDKLSALLTDRATVRGIAASLVEYSNKKFPELKDDAKGFTQKLEATALQDRIGKNLSQNPDLVKKLAKAMSEEGPSNKAMDNQVRGMLKDIYTKPDETIANKGWTDGLQGKMAMGGAMDWVKTNLGIDLQGMLGGLGNMIQGMFAKIGSFMQNFFNGNVMQIGAMDPKASMLTKMSRSWDQSNDFQARKAALIDQSELIRRPGADPKSTLNDGSRLENGERRMITTEKTNQNGQKVETQEVDYRANQDHRVGITPIGNKEMKVFMTDGVQPTREPNGNYRWTVATEVNPHNGKPGDIQQVIVSEQESQRMFKVMEDAAKASGKTLRIENPHANPNMVTPEVKSGLTVAASFDGSGRQREWNVGTPGGPGTGSPAAPSALNTINQPKPGDPQYTPGVPSGGAVA